MVSIIEQIGTLVILKKITHEVDSELGSPTSSAISETQIRAEVQPIDGSEEFYSKDGVYALGDAIMFCPPYDDINKIPFVGDRIVWRDTEYLVKTMQRWCVANKLIYLECHLGKTRVSGEDK